MAEFAPADEPMQIMTVSGDSTYELHTLADYLPMPFRLEE
jgi:cytidine deaminase